MMGLSDPLVENDDLAEIAPLGLHPGDRELCLVAESSNATVKQL
jgi:hypothetical protein